MCSSTGFGGHYPRLLFKGGTSLSKSFGLINRFSEDIDITVFRNDLGEPASIEELEGLSRKKRRARLDAIKATCLTLAPSPAMLEPLERDYHAMAGMIMGAAPPFRDIMDAVSALERQLNE